MRSFRSSAVAVMVLLAGASGCGEVPGTAKKKKSSTSQRPPAVASDAYGSVAEAVSELVQSAEAHNLKKQDRAAAWLVDRGEPAIDPLTAILSSTDQAEPARVAACQVLSKLGPAARPALLRATDDPVRMVRISATRRLGLIRPADQQAVDRLVTLLEHEDQQTRRAAVQALGSIGKPAEAAIDPLVEIYNNNRNKNLLRNDAVQALKKINPRKDFTDLLLND